MPESAMPVADTDAADRRRASYHEAGHAVVAWCRGLDVGDLWLKGAGGAGADIRNAAHLPVVDQVAICMAGSSGAELSGVAAGPSEETLNDELAVRELIESAFPDDPDAQERLRDQGDALATKIVVGAKDSVVELGDELDRTGRLNSAAVTKILQRTCPRRDA